MEKLAIDFIAGVDDKSVPRFVEVRRTVPPESDLLIVVASPGGFNVWSRILNSCLTTLPDTVRVTTCACGTVDSAAVSFYSLGKERVCLPGCRFLLHFASVDVQRLNHVRAKELNIELFNDDMATIDIVSAATNNTKEEVYSWLAQNTVWDCSQAIANGLVHREVEKVSTLYEGRRRIGILPNDQTATIPVPSVPLACN